MLLALALYPTLWFSESCFNPLALPKTVIYACEAFRAWSSVSLVGVLGRVQHSVELESGISWSPRQLVQLLQLQLNNRRSSKA